MNKKIFALAILAISCVSLSYGQSLTKETRTIGEFDRITSSNGIIVHISEGQSSTLEIETNYDDMLNSIKTEVVKGELKLSLKNDFWNGRKNLKVDIYLSATGLKSLEASSGSYFKSEEQLTVKDLEIEISSGGGTDLDIKANKINCSVSSGSIINLKGQAENITIEASSRANVKIKELLVTTAYASASSGAFIELTVSKKLKATASSGAKIRYAGDVDDVITSKSSGGSITKD